MCADDRRAPESSLSTVGTEAFAVSHWFVIKEYNGDRSELKCKTNCRLLPAKLARRLTIVEGVLDRVWEKRSQRYFPKFHEKSNGYIRALSLLEN